MTQVLQQAWDRISVLPEDRQESIAYMILEEIKDDNHWNQQFDSSKDKLHKIADKVRDDIKTNKIQRKGFGEL